MLKPVGEKKQAAVNQYLELSAPETQNMSPTGSGGKLNTENKDQQAVLKHQPVSHTSVEADPDDRQQKANQGMSLLQC